MRTRNTGSTKKVVSIRCNFINTKMRNHDLVLVGKQLLYSLIINFVSSKVQVQQHCRGLFFAYGFQQRQNVSYRISWYGGNIAIQKTLVHDRLLLVVCKHCPGEPITQSRTRIFSRLLNIGKQQQGREESHHGPAQRVSPRKSFVVFPFHAIPRYNSCYCAAPILIPA